MQYIRHVAHLIADVTSVEWTSDLYPNRQPRLRLIIVTDKRISNNLKLRGRSHRRDQKYTVLEQETRSLRI